MLHSTAIYIIIIHLFHANVTQQKKDDPKVALSLIYRLLIPSFWWRGASVILFPSSCELMPICNPNKQQELVSKLEAIGSPTSNNDDSDLMSLG